MLAKKHPTKALAATSLQVNDERYNATQIRKLYDDERYRLTRENPSL